MASMTQGARRIRSERGAELIEFALVLPLLLFILAGIMDFGILFQRFEVVTNAAREGARIAVLPGYTTADVQSRVQSYLTNGGVPTPAGTLAVSVTDVTIPVPSGTPLPAKSVGVTYTSSYLFLGPIASWFGGSFTTVPLSATAVMRPEVPAGS